MCWSKTFPFYVASGPVSSILEGWRFTSLIFFCVRWMCIPLSFSASSVSSNVCQWWRGLPLPMLHVSLFEGTKITLCTLARSLAWLFFTALALSLSLSAFHSFHPFLVLLSATWSWSHSLPLCTWLKSVVLLTALNWYDCVLILPQSTIYSLFLSYFWLLFMQ